MLINITSLSSSNNDHVLVDHRKVALKHTLHVKSRHVELSQNKETTFSLCRPPNASSTSRWLFSLIIRKGVGMGCVKNERQLKI